MSKPFRIGLSCHYGPLWVNEYVLAETEDEALNKYKMLKPNSNPEEAICLPSWFPELANWEIIKDLIENKEGVFSWPNE